jgi:hypothetical protein
MLKYCRNDGVMSPYGPSARCLRTLSCQSLARSTVDFWKSGMGLIASQNRFRLIPTIIPWNGRDSGPGQARRRGTHHGATEDTEGARRSGLSSPCPLRVLRGSVVSRTLPPRPANSLPDRGANHTPWNHSMNSRG